MCGVFVTLIQLVLNRGAITACTRRSNKQLFVLTTMDSQTRDSSEYSMTVINGQIY